MAGRTYRSLTDGLEKILMIVYCPQCEAANSPEAPACEFCGHQLLATTKHAVPTTDDMVAGDMPSSESLHRKKTNWIVQVIAGVMILVIVAATVMYVASIE